MATKQINLPEVGSVTLYKRRGNRSLRLSLGASGEVRVSLPAWLPYKLGVQFALSKKDWILQHRSRSNLLVSGHRIGKAHRLTIEPKESLLRVHTQLVQNEVRVTHSPDLAAAHASVQTAAQKACIRALKREAEQLLPQRLMQLGNQTQLNYNSVAVKQLKSRWGSCSSTRDITLNLFLMQLPWHLIDYVLVHELVHTKIMRHGPPFWQELERHLENSKQLRQEIATHQPVLIPQL